MIVVVTECESGAGIKTEGSRGRIGSCASSPTLCFGPLVRPVEECQERKQPDAGELHNVGDLRMVPGAIGEHRRVPDAVCVFEASPIILISKED